MIDRSLALTLLRTVLERKATLDDALARLPTAAPRDRASAHRLAATVLRRLGTLDAMVEPYLCRQPPEPVRLILALGAAQLLFLQTPAHAAVATSVDLARQSGFAPHAGMVNAVLRRVIDHAAMLDDLDSPRLDTPVWLWRSWGDRARAIALAHQHEAPIDLTLRDPAGEAPPGGVALANGSWRYAPGTRIADLPGYDEGRFWVQDQAASLPAALLAVRPGEYVADLCAAPGGKSAQLAAAGAELVAVERDPARARRLRDNLHRLSLPAEIVIEDAAQWRPARPFDAILLDAPCSATGTIRRHPDVARLKQAQDISVLAQAQERLLAAAAQMLRPGGRLVYAVCSLQPEEGEAIIPKAAAHGLQFAPFTTAECPIGHQDGAMRTDPSMGMDGFFAARFVKLA